jgi:hypothetical protein
MAGLEGSKIPNQHRTNERPGRRFFYKTAIIDKKQTGPCGPARMSVGLSMIFHNYREVNWRQVSNQNTVGTY